MPEFTSRLIRTSALSLLLVAAACNGSSDVDLPEDDGDRAERGEFEQFYASGTIRDGVECPILTSDDGTTYALLGEHDFPVGARVEMRARQVEVSYCQQGTPVQVTSLTRIDGDNPGSGNPGSGNGNDTETITVAGRVTQGAECPILNGADGRTYSLAGNPSVASDAYVEVTGELAEMSYCMAGDATIAVSSVQSVTPPQNELPPDYQTISQDYALGSWAAKGNDCSKPDFAITGNNAGGQVVETSLNGAPRTGSVQLGADPGFEFDQPQRRMRIEKRSPDAMAVFPPASGPVDLGGNRLDGDGVVFVRCG